MSDYMLISKAGIIPHEWDSETETYVPERNASESATNGLRNRVEIAPDLTLLDLFRAVAKDHVLRGFLSLYSWNPWITEFHDQAEEPRPVVAESPDSEEMEALLISYYVDIKDHGVDVGPHFSGLGKDGTSYSVSTCPMYDLAHLPIRLAPKAVIRRNYEVIAEVPHTYSLLDLLDAIYWDISFHGSPKENAEFLEYLKNAIDEVKELAELPLSPPSLSTTESDDLG